MLGARMALLVDSPDVGRGEGDGELLVLEAASRSHGEWIVDYRYQWPMLSVRSGAMNGGRDGGGCEPGLFRSLVRW